MSPAWGEQRSECHNARTTRVRVPDGYPLVPVGYPRGIPRGTHGVRTRGGIRRVPARYMSRTCTYTDDKHNGDFFLFYLQSQKNFLFYARVGYILTIDFFYQRQSALTHNRSLASLSSVQLVQEEHILAQFERERWIGGLDQ